LVNSKPDNLIKRHIKEYILGNLPEKLTEEVKLNPGANLGQVENIDSDLRGFKQSSFLKKLEESKGSTQRQFKKTTIY
jgi:hypothetical protein